MKPIATAITVLFTSFALISCGGKKEGGTEAEASAKSHAEIADGVVGEMTTMMNGMAGIKDVASAEAFAATVPTTKTKLKELLKSAQALPAPTEEEKADFQAKMDAAQEKAGPAMMAMMMGLSQNPEAEAIGKVMEGVMNDDEMDKVTDTLEQMYAVSETEESEPAPGE